MPIQFLNRRHRKSSVTPGLKELSVSEQLQVQSIEIARRGSSYDSPGIASSKATEPLSKVTEPISMVTEPISMVTEPLTMVTEPLKVGQEIIEPIFIKSHSPTKEEIAEEKGLKACITLL